MEYKEQREKDCLDIKSISFSDQEGIFNVWDLTQKIIDSGIGGDLAEAGVTAGANPIIMSKVCRLNNSQRKVRMLDSFCGHPQALPTEHEELQRNYGTRDGDILYNIKNGSNYDVQNAKNYVKKFDGWEDIIEYHVGFFQDTFPNLPEFKLALLRTDVNLCESHKLCMEYLYPRLVNGGYFISDDYIQPDIRKEIDAFVKKNKIKPTVIGSENHIIYWQK